MIETMGVAHGARACQRIGCDRAATTRRTVPGRVFPRVVEYVDVCERCAAEHDGVARNDPRLSELQAVLARALVDGAVVPMAPEAAELVARVLTPQKGGETETTARRSVLEYVLCHPGATAQDISDAQDRPVRSVGMFLRTLGVERVLVRKRNRWFLAAERCEGGT